MSTDSVVANTSSSSVVAVGGSVTGSIDFGFDQDWYQVSLIAGHQYEFALLAWDSGLGTLDDPFLRLLNSSGALIASDDDSGAGLESRITYTASSSGALFLSAQGSQVFFWDTGTFVLAATDLGSNVDVADNTGTSGTLVAGGSVTGTIGFSGDQDWYRVTLTAGHQYRFGLHGIDTVQGTLNDPFLRLLDSSGVEIASDDDSGIGLESRIAYTATQSGDWFLSAQASGSGVGTFALEVSDLGASASDAVPGSTATGSSLAVGGSVTGTIDLGGDQDWYRVSLVAGHQYRFDLLGFDSAQGTLDDPYLRLLDGSGVEIAFDDDSGTGLESSITFTTSSSGTLFLSAQGFVSDTGTFTLSATDLGAVDADVLESPLTQEAVEVGSSVNGTIDASGDQDWYRVQLINGHTYRFDLRGALSGQGTLVDPLLWLLDSSGLEITHNDDSGDTLESSIVYTPTQAGTYLLSAEGYLSATGTFSLSVTELTGGAGDVPGSTSTNSLVSMGGSVAGTISPVGDQDWYRVSLVADREYRFDLQGAESGHGTIADPILRLLDGSGWELDYSDYIGTVDESITYIPNYSGIYFLSAQGWLSNTGTFTLSATDVHAGQDDVAQDIGTGASVVVGGSVTGTIGFAGDQDWYQVSLVAGHNYRFDLQGFDSWPPTLPDRNLQLTDPYLVLLDSAGVEISSDDDSGTGLEARITYTPSQSGTYFLSAQGFAGYGTGGFTLSATDTYVDVPGSIVTSSALTTRGEVVTGLIDASGDEDWYRVSLVAGHRYAFDLQGHDSGQYTLADPLLRLLDGSGAELTFDDDSGLGFDSSIVFTPVAPGNYYLSVHGYSSSAGTYAISAFDFDDPGDVPGNTGTGSMLPIGGSVTGTIDAPIDGVGDQDWYRVSLVAGHIYRLDMQGAASDHGSLADPLVRLLDSSGEEIFANDNAFGSLDAVLDGITSIDGTYYISAEGSGSSTGTFTISVADLTALADDVPGDTSTSSAVAVDGSVTGLINGKNGAYDDDWYRVSLAANRTYQFDLKGAALNWGTLTDPYLALYDSSGSSSPISSDNDSGSGNDASILYTTSSTGAGTYYLSAGGITLSDFGSFTLSVTDWTGTGDVAASTATSGATFAGNSLTGTIGFGGDWDWYRISLVAGHTYQFDLQGAAFSWGTLTDPYLELFNSAGTFIKGNNDVASNNKDSSFTYTPSLSGTYYLSAEGNLLTDIGSFTLSVTDWTATGDVPANSGTGSGVAVDGFVTGSISNSGENFDFDWYRVSLVAGRTYQFDLKGATYNWGTLTDPYLELFGSAGTFIQGNNDVGVNNNDSSITYTPSSSGTYYLSAEGNLLTDIGSFTLSVTDRTGTGDVAASTATSGATFAGSSLTGTIGFGGDWDWYRISLVAGHQYDFSLQGSESNWGTLGNPYLRLLDSEGKQIAFDDDSGGGLDSDIKFAAALSGTYYLSAESVGTGTGSFLLDAIDITPSVKDVPGDTGTSSVVAVGGAVKGEIGLVDDQDWYQVSLTAQHTYNFYLRGAASENGTLADPILRLLDASGIEHGYSDEIGTADESITAYTPTESGIYFVSVEPWSTNTGTYVLSVIEGADVVLGSTVTTDVVAVGRSVKGKVDTSGDQDWYRVELLAGHQYNFLLKGAASGHGTITDPILRLLDGSGGLILTSDLIGTADESIAYTASQSGVYFLSAQGYSTNTGTFTLNVIDTKSADVPANTSTPVTMLSTGGAIAGTIDAIGDQDWYRISLVAGHTYRLDMQGAASNHGSLADPVVRLLDSAGNEIFENDDSFGTLDAVLDGTTTIDGTYYISAQGSGSNTGTFTITVADLTALADDVPANSGTGSGVAADGSVTGLISSDGATFDDDWYRVSLAAHHTYQFDLKGAALNWGTLTDPYLELFNSSGTRIAFDNDSGYGNDASISYSTGTLDAGTYYLSAGGWTLSDSGSFTLSVDDPARSLDVPGSTATTRTAYVGGDLTGSIGTSGDQDWYRISLLAGHQYEFGLQGSALGWGTLADPYLRLLDSEGKQIDFDDESGSGHDSSLKFAAVQSGTYYLSAQSYGTGTGTYLLGAADITLSSKDVPGSTATYSVVAVGGAVEGEITSDPAGDQDWYQVSLTSGHEYRFDLQGAASDHGTITDPILSLLDASGAVELGYSDYVGTADESITYFASQSGTYFLAVQGWDTNTGTFTLNVTDLNGGVAPQYATSDNHVLRGDELNNILFGTDGADQLDGKGGDDRLEGGAGDDSLSGGAGNDTLIGGDGNDVFLQTTLESLGDDSLEGGASNDLFNDWFGHNVLDGGAGDDHFTIYIADAEATNRVTGGDGQDSYELLPGTSSPSSLAYVVTDFEVGIGGDLLDLHALLDASAGDRFYLEASSSVSVEESSSVSDFLRLLQFGPDTLVQWDRDGASLGGYAWVTQLTLKNIDATKINSYNFLGTVDIGNKDDNRLVGGAGNDSIFGADGDDILSGGGGADLLTGGAGADLYYVDDPKDEVIETDNTPSGSDGIRLQLDLGSTIDTVISSINFTLGAYLENLTLAAGTSNLAGVGNLLDNVLLGNAGDNILVGSAGNDTLDGGAGADRLTGGEGDDTLNGGSGEDVAVYSGARSEYSIAYDSATSGFTVTSQAEGRDTLSGVESVAFSNMAFALTVGGASTLSGKLYFWNKVAAQGSHSAGHVLLDGVTVRADDAGTAREGTTAAGGAYSVANIAATSVAVGASLAVSTADKATVTLGDALEVLKLYLGKLSSPSPYKVLASDFNADNKVTLTDALGILKAVLNKAGALEPAWVFVDEEANLSGLSNTSATQPAVDAHPVTTDPSLNLVAVLRGDANGSWKPASTASYEVLPDTYFTELVAQHPDTMTLGQFGL